MDSRVSSDAETSRLIATLPSRPYHRPSKLESHRHILDTKIYRRCLNPGLPQTMDTRKRRRLVARDDAHRVLANPQTRTKYEEHQPGGFSNASTSLPRPRRNATSQPGTAGIGNSADSAVDLGVFRRSGAKVKKDDEPGIWWGFYARGGPHSHTTKHQSRELLRFSACHPSSDGMAQT
jgi:hypothetical protein